MTDGRTESLRIELFRSNLCVLLSDVKEEITEATLRLHLHRQHCQRLKIASAKGDGQKCQCGRFPLAPLYVHFLPCIYIGLICTNKERLLAGIYAGAGPYT